MTCNDRTFNDLPMALEDIPRRLDGIEFVRVGGAVRWSEEVINLTGALSVRFGSLF
jgi:hypothetical protein